MAITPGGLSIMRALLFTIGLIHVSNIFMHSSAAVIPLDSGLSIPIRTPNFAVRHHLFERASNDSSCKVEPYTAPAVGQQQFAPFDQAKATVFRYRQQQSVNLGSWFAHENWMTPSLFKCASGHKSAELDIANGWGSVENARALLERHWDTFITKSDFDYLSSIGINTVRLPIGYWNLGPDFCKGTPFENVSSVYQNSWPRVVRTINMAKDAGIGVLVDLHGAVGSQNGQAHSGVSTGGVQLFDNQGNVDKTMNVLKFLTKELANVTNVVGIEILNEPKAVPGLEDFYTKAINTMRNVSEAAKSLPLYIHDGFDLNRLNKLVASRKDFVVLDTHTYFVFKKSDQTISVTEHTKNIKSSVLTRLTGAAEQQRRNLIVGEWSCATSPGSAKQETNIVGAQKAYCSAQLKTFTKAGAGWAFWAYKKENCDSDPGWCFKSAVGRTLPSSFFSYDSAGSSTSSSSSAGPSKTPITKQRRSRHHLNIRRANNSKGYTDGLQAAKDFAAVGKSKLGFSGQFIQDNLAKLGSSVDSKTYGDDFMKGLTDGQASVKP